MASTVMPAATLQSQMAELYNPFTPIPTAMKRDRQVSGARYNQRLRRSEILATIRKIVTQEGCENVTVRHVAELSGYAVQTVYNLVGRRNEAISDALSEYSIFVARTANPGIHDPTALPCIVNSWVDATRLTAAAALTRQFSLTYFSQNREIYYRFRDRQHVGMRNFLKRQKAAGVLRANVEVNALAEHLVIYSSGVWLEWADRQFSMNQLSHKLTSGFANLLASNLEAQHAHVIEEWLESTRRSGPLPSFSITTP